MGKISTLGLSKEEKAALKKGAKNPRNTWFGKRCQLILLKEQGLSGMEVANKLNMSRPSITNWLRRYRKEGIEGLKMKKRRRKGQRNETTA